MYGELRRPTASALNGVAATPRQLESLIRIAEAMAKMELREARRDADCVQGVGGRCVRALRGCIFVYCLTATGLDAARCQAVGQ